MLMSSHQSHTPAFSFHSQPLGRYDRRPSVPSTRPFCFPGASSQSISSSRDVSVKSHAQAQNQPPPPHLVDLAAASSSSSPSLTADAGSLDVWGNYQLMPAQSQSQSQSQNLQAPPIRVQRSSPSPQLLHNQSSPSHPLLAESCLPQAQWPTSDDSLGPAHQAVRQRDQSLDRRGATHQRNTSGSSIGSAGPASPYDSSHSQPYIAGSDGSLSPSGVDSSYYDGLPQHADQAAFLNFAKHLSSVSPPEPLGPTYQDYDTQRDSVPNLEAKLAMIQFLRDQQIPAEKASPVPEFSTPDGRPSVSSVDQRSPMTPRTLPAEDYEDNLKSGANGEDYASVESWMDQDLRDPDCLDLRTSAPKLDRTMSDAFQDELFNPSMYAATSSLHQPPTLSTSANNNNTTNNNHHLLSPYRNVFSERIHDANQVRSQSPISSSPRDRSPFRPNSPFAASMQSFGSHSPQTRLGTASHLREEQKAEVDSMELQQHQQCANARMSTPNTISPKDALLEFHETAEDASTPLFPSDHPAPSNATNTQFGGVSTMQANLEDAFAAEQAFGRLPAGTPDPANYSLAPGHHHQAGASFTFVPPSVPGSVQMPSQQQYPFVQQSRRPNTYAPSSGRSEQTPEFPAHLISMETSSSEAPDSSSTGEVMRKPSGTLADTGTYTCTYHGCTQRFETPAKLQKHKREGHRQATPAHLSGAASNSGSSTSSRPSAAVAGAGGGGGAAGAEAAGSGMTSEASMRNSQAGPHKCDRINPSTGKPCNTIFSRPYDLTRHEDTIHNARKQKVRCQFCTEDKTFSRNDALTRHMRVVHPDVEFGGRPRRKPHT
ncbi:MAG: hypothetical protein M1837_002068 [Sclerophora amabilis]|nr:MAG: hypothetical protein M1837_002068 [Sclerophora amabilis]